MVLPHFIINAPLFFAQLDLFYYQKVISYQEDMLGYVVVVLLQDIISKPYNKLCNKFTAYATVSTHKCITQLLEQETLRDSTPSKFLKQLQKLVEGTVEYLPSINW